MFIEKLTPSQLKSAFEGSRNIENYREGGYKVLKTLPIANLGKGKHISIKGTWNEQVLAMCFDFDVSYFMDIEVEQNLGKAWRAFMYETFGEEYKNAYVKQEEEKIKYSIKELNDDIEIMTAGTEPEIDR